MFIQLSVHLFSIVPLASCFFLIKARSKFCGWDIDSDRSNLIKDALNLVQFKCHDVFVTIY